MVILEKIKQHIEKLCAIEEIPDLLKATEKFLTYFHKWLREELEVDEYFFRANRLFETAVLDCDDSNDNYEYISKGLKCLFDLCQQDFVRQNLVYEILSTISRTIANLSQNKVEQMKELFNIKIPKLMVHLSRMDNYGIMRYVLVIIFEYLIKFDEKEKHDSFIKIAQGIKGQQLQLLEASNIMAWSPELFEIRSRTFLNSIPDKKCYSLAATSAILGVVKLVPIPGRDFISFEWNSNPRELHFEALIGGDDTVKTIEASIELDSMKDLIILGNDNNPQIRCFYDKIAVTGYISETYELLINVLNENDVQQLGSFIRPRMESVKIINANNKCDSVCDEQMIRREKFYNTADLSIICASAANCSKTSAAFHSVSTNPVEALSIQENESIGPVAAQSIPDNENIGALANESTHKDTGNTSGNVSGQKNQQCNSTMLANVGHLRSTPVEQNRSKAENITYDPYDLENYCEDESSIYLKSRSKKRTGKGRSASKQKMRQGSTKKPIINPRSSTPTKRPIKPLLEPTISAIRAKYIDDLSSIESGSEVEKSYDSDSSFQPYEMLSRKFSYIASGPKRITRSSVLSNDRNKSSKTLDWVKQSFKTNHEKSSLNPENTNQSGNKPNTGEEKHTTDDGELNHSLNSKILQQHRNMNMILNSESLSSNFQTQSLKRKQQMFSRTNQIISIDSTSVEPTINLCSPPKRSSPSPYAPRRNGVVMTGQSLMDLVPRQHVDNSSFLVDSDEMQHEGTAFTHVQRVLDSIIETNVHGIEKSYKERVAKISDIVQKNINSRLSEYNNIKQKYERYVQKKQDMLNERNELQKMAIQFKRNRKNFDEIDRMIANSIQSDTMLVEKIRSQSADMQKVFQDANAKDWQQCKASFLRQVQMVLFGNDADIL